MLIDAFHAALKHAVEAVDSVGVHHATAIFASAVGGENVARKVRAMAGVLQGCCRLRGRKALAHLRDDVRPGREQRSYAGSREQRSRLS